MEAAADNGCPRSTVQDVYTQITTDLTTAVDLLKKAESAGRRKKRTNAISALPLLMDYKLSVYLSMHEYAQAATAAVMQ